MTILLSLDFDGVLHSLEAAHQVSVTSLPVAELVAAGLLVHNQLLEGLLMRHDRIEIVVHSSWRLAHSEARLRELLGPLGHRMRGITTKSIESREASILDTLRRWQVPRRHLVVLDDEVSSFTELAEQLVPCDSRNGVLPVLDALDIALRNAAAAPAIP